MTELPDLSDPRYLDEVGWFLQREDYVYGTARGSFEEERLGSSKRLCTEILEGINQDGAWLSRATVISIGSGCTGDLSAWDAAAKVAIDPLFDTYQDLDMLVPDLPGTAPTIYLSVPIEDVPVIGGTADLLLCRNALDHMPHPREAVQQMWRMTKPNGLFWVSVDIGGEPTPDEPTVFSEDSLRSLIESHFEPISEPQRGDPHSDQRELSITLVARKKGEEPRKLNKRAVLAAYQDRVEERWGPGSVVRNPNAFTP